MSAVTKMADAPLVSVIIPCFNYARYVGAAIESVLAQSYPHKELIVVNDGSRDNSLEVIGRYADRVQIIDQPNQGSVTAYNRGVTAARGSLVMFLDADDLLAPDALSRVAAAFYPGCAKVQYELSIIDGEGAQLGRRFCNYPGGYDAARVRASFSRHGTYRWPVTVGNAYARWFVDEIFPLTGERGPDGRLNTVAPVYGDVVTLPKVLGYYRLHGNNQWSSNGLDVARLPKRIRDRQHEVAFMRAHAAARGIAVPDLNVLDYELPFLNYRLLALKLGLEYPGSDRDSPGLLVLRAMRLLFQEPPALPLAASHVAWFAALLVSPAVWTRRLVALRFNRAALRRSLAQRVRVSVGGRASAKESKLG